MDVTDVARSLGLASDDRGEVSGTIDQEVVLTAMSALAAEHPGNDDVFADAVMRVQLARSAGVEHLDANGVFNRARAGATVQLRYRAEMADVFLDLAIDIGLRDAGQLADTPV